MCETRSGLASQILAEDPVLIARSLPIRRIRMIFLDDDEAFAENFPIYATPERQGLPKC